MTNLKEVGPRDREIRLVKSGKRGTAIATRHFPTKLLKVPTKLLKAKTFF